MSNLTQQPQPPQAALDQIIGLYNQGELEQTVSLAESLAGQYPNTLLLYDILGAAHMGLKNADKTIASYQKVLQLNPNHTDAHNNMGMALYDQGRFDEAVESYKKAVKLEPDFADAHYNLGNALKQTGDLKQAIASYKASIAINPNDTEVLLNYGNALTNYGDFDHAIEIYAKAIKIKPDYADAHYNMGNTLTDKGELDAAIDSYKKAIRIKPDYAEAYVNMGNALKDNGDSHAAIDNYKQAIKIKPDYADAYSNMGNALKDKGELYAAIDSYKQAIKIKPDFGEAYNNMGNALKEKGEVDAAIDSFKQAIKIKPDYADAKHLLASLTGETTKAAPRQYVEGLFDQYAAKFEHSLIENLQYQTPKIITEMIINRHPRKTLGSVLDLGCGTGLAGLELRQFCENLDGIDLSEAMLKQARAKGVYGKLIHGDIAEHLAEADLDFDYFISTDVFIYVGELSDIFRLIKSRNRRRAKLVFSTEHAEGKDFYLEKSGRYSHSKNYIEGLCIKYGYHLSHFEKTKLRKEKGEFLTGGLYLLDFDPAE